MRSVSVSLIIRKAVKSPIQTHFERDRATSDKMNGWLALSPIFVFLGVYLVTSIVVNDFYSVPITAAFVIATVYAMLITRRYEKLDRMLDIFSEGASNRNVLIMIWIFVLAGAFTTYSPVVDLLKGILVSLVAISSLSSFLYGSMINFGKKLGVALDVAAVAGWQLLVPMGIMGVWTLMQNVRIWMVFAMFLAALVWYFLEKKGVLKR